MQNHLLQKGFRQNLSLKILVIARGIQIRLLTKAQLHLILKEVSKLSLIWRGTDWLPIFTGLNRERQSCFWVMSLCKIKYPPHSGSVTHWPPSKISVVGSLRTCHEEKASWKGTELHVSHWKLTQEPVSS